jgi:hypothetical protein
MEPAAASRAARVGRDGGEQDDGPRHHAAGKHELSVVKLADSSCLSNGHATVTAQ